MCTKLQVEGGMYMGRQLGRNLLKGRKCCNESGKKEALESDPCAVAWKIRFHDKVMPQTVGHVPREISRPIY